MTEDEIRRPETVICNKRERRRSVLLVHRVLTLIGVASVFSNVGLPVFAQGNIPGGIHTVGLSRIVADKIIFSSELNNLGSWEPYTSVLGEETFLIVANTFAENSTTQQRFGMVFQPANGGNSTTGDVFFADNSIPFRGAINASRQDGNPARVAGDKRPGASCFLAGAEASPHGIAAFQSDTRFSISNLYSTYPNARYSCAQTFVLDHGNLSQTPVCKLFDVANGRLTSGTPYGSEITRYGGDIAALDNGNFVSVVEDRSYLRNLSGRAVVATIMAPDGSIVRESFVVENNETWANVAAHRGGFAVRVGRSGKIYFYDNVGNLRGQIDHTQFLTLQPALDRGDENRIAAHINSPFVYLAGRSPLSNGLYTVRIAAFNAQNQTFAAVTNVTELSPASGGQDTNDFSGPLGFFSRVTLAVDALDRVAVVFGSMPAGYGFEQATARVLAFDTAAKQFSHLTGSFFVFTNNAPTGGIRSVAPSVSMTTRAICVSAKGEINSDNNPALGADTPSRANFYTVFSHPDPKDDPTPPTSLQIHRGLQRTAVITWADTLDAFVLETTGNPALGNWVQLATQSPVTIVCTNDAGFFRLRK